MKRILIIPFFMLGILVRGQWSETFSGMESPDLNWLGETSSLVINSSGQWQLNAAAAGNTTVGLACSLPPDSIWEFSFYLRHSFSGSNNNYSRIYLTANEQPDSAGHDQSGGCQGYFLQLGSSGSNDAIEFYRDDATGSPTLLISGLAGQISTGVNGSFHVMKDNEWHIYFQDNDSTQFQWVGDVEDNTYTNFSYFFFQAYCTGSNIHNFYLDNVIIGPPPEPVVPLHLNYRAVVFNEILADPSPSVGLPDVEYVELYNASADTIQLEGFTLYNTTTSMAFPSAVLMPLGYLILCANEDVFAFNQACGFSSFSALTNTGDSLTLVDPSGQVVDFLTYPDLTQLYPQYEGGIAWEQKRPGAPVFYTDNWQLSCNPEGGSPGQENCGYTDDLPEEPVWNPLGMDVSGRLYLSSVPPLDTTHLLLFWDQQPIHPYVFLSHDTLVVTGLLADSLSHQLQVTLAQDVWGRSLIHTSWNLSLPIPPKKHQLLFNEVLYDSPVLCPEFVEIINPSDRFLCLDGIQLINHLGYSSSTFTNHRVLAPGEILCLTENPVQLSSAYTLSPSAKTTFRPPNQLEKTSTLPLMSETEHLVLMIQNDTLDVLQYNPEFHHPWIEDTQGISLERVLLRVDMPFSSIWKSAAENVKATPGYSNSQSISMENQGQLSISPPCFSPNNDGINDCVLIQCSWEKNENIVWVRIWNEAGESVKTLCDHQVIGKEACWTWDGTDDTGQLLLPGIYLLQIWTGNQDNVWSKQLKSIVFSP